MDKIGFIGMGNMGQALLSGALKNMPKSRFIFSDHAASAADDIAKRTGVKRAVDNVSCIKASKYVFLAVKPQYFNSVAEEIKDTVSSAAKGASESDAGEEKIIVSIMAGITIDSIKKALGKNVRVIRVMPNTPALVLEGMSGVCFDESEYTKEERDTVIGIFESCGRVKIVNESLMSAVTCISGSSPAYVYMFIEALADSGVKYGLTRDMAYEMAAQTVLGAAKMVLESGEVPAALKDKVCSPAGTTIAGVAALEEFGFRNAVFKATDKCFEKAESFK